MNNNFKWYTGWLYFNWKRFADCKILFLIYKKSKNLSYPFGEMGQFYILSYDLLKEDGHVVNFNCVPSFELIQFLHIVEIVRLLKCDLLRGKWKKFWRWLVMVTQQEVCDLLNQKYILGKWQYQNILACKQVPSLQNLQAMFFGNQNLEKNIVFSGECTFQ